MAAAKRAKMAEEDKAQMDSLRKEACQPILTEQDKKRRKHWFSPIDAFIGWWKEWKKRKKINRTFDAHTPPPNGTP